MTRAAWLAAVAVIAFILILTVNAPPSLFIRLIDRMPATVTATGLSGTFWRGQAGGLQVGGIQLGRLHWEVRATALLRARLEVRLELDGQEAMLRGHIDAGRRETTVSGVDAMMPSWLIADLAGVEGPIDAWVGVTGMALTLHDGRPSAVSGEVRLQQVQLILGERITLGDYKMTLGMDGDLIVAVLRDEAGILVVDGAVTVDVTGVWVSDLRLAERGDDERIRAALAMLGERDEDGFVRLRLSGTLR